MTIKGLVSQSPVRWPDGTLFIGHKSSSFYALDIATGTLMFSYGEENQDSGGLSEDTMNAFSGDSPHYILLTRTSYGLHCFASGRSKDSDGDLSINQSWNVIFSEYGSFINPFHPLKPQKSDSMPSSSWVQLFSSFNGLIIAMDAKSRQVLWVRRLSSIAVAFYELTDAQDGTTIGPILRSIPIQSSPLDHDGHLLEGQVIINLGKLASSDGEESLLFVLPSRFFPIVSTGYFNQESGSNVDHEDQQKQHQGTQMMLGTHLQINRSLPDLVYHHQHYFELAEDCRPGSPDFPACLVGSHRATILLPVPLLNAHNEKKPFIVFDRTFAFTMLSIIMSMLFIYWFQRRKRKPNQLASRKSETMIPRPPGFEEISIDSANLFYSAQSTSSRGAPPNSFMISDQVIGYGSHGTVVFAGIYDNRPVAVKRMLIDFYDVAGHEAELLQSSDHHPNIVRYFCREVTEKFAYIVLELCIGSLADLYEHPEGKFTKEQKETLCGNPMSILQQMTTGLEHLHSLNLIHRDIKPHNILITPQLRLVLSDFGVGRQLAQDQTSFNPTVQAGTIGWRAPECILSEESQKFALNGEVKITRAIDVFALGCVFYYVLTKGEHPFGNRLEREMNIVRNTPNLDLLQNEPAALDLVARTLDRLPTSRPSCSQILAHPYFWPASKQISLLLDLSDRLEFEDRLPSSDILHRLEARRLAIFDGSTIWHKSIDQAVWLDLCSYRKYNPHSVQDLIRAIRNKRNHFHELTLELRAILGETPEAFMKYFLKRFPRLIIEIYRLIESTLMRYDNPFAGYFV